MLTSSVTVTAVPTRTVNERQKLTAKHQNTNNISIHDTSDMKKIRTTPTATVTMNTKTRTFVKRKVLGRSGEAFEMYNFERLKTTDHVNRKVIIEARCKLCKAISKNTSSRRLENHWYVRIHGIHI